MTDPAPHLSRDELGALDAAIEQALDRAEQGELEILGYGEISSAVAWPAAGGKLACKRLPLFTDQAAVAAYREAFATYLDALDQRGVDVLPSRLFELGRGDGRWAVYCVQPVADAETLAPRVFAGLDAGAATARFEELLDVILGCVGPRLGLDGQLSNWVVAGDRLAYLDVSTPMLRDAEGREQLDVELFLASLPWALRPLVRRFLLRGILDKYYRPRGVVLDLLGNLYKERLEPLLPRLVEVANRRVDPPLSEREVLGYYRSDARTWALLQRLRRLDRTWQRRVRRRQYPFLLPGRIAR